MQFIRDLREVTGTLKELVADDERHEEDAKLELAVSTQRFTQETREVVDDKLSFSATLMRAGEVGAAQRLLAEVEAEVRENEAALVEQVNEVKVARAARRERITRMRLARSLAAAMLGAAVMATSAAGMGFASFLEDRARTDDAAAARPAGGHTGSARRGEPVAARPGRTGNVEKVQFRGVEKALTAQALAAYEQLKSGEVDAGEMEHLLSLLPQELAETMREALTTAAVAEKTVKDTAPELLDRASARARAKAARAAKAAGDDQPKQDPADEEPKGEGGEPSPQPSPGGGEEEDPEDPDDSAGVPIVDS
jgi:hypothetical protein